MVLIVSSVFGIMNVMCLFVPAAAYLIILVSLGAITIAEWAE
jgi:hypothetical protein